jgi:hypothetical protein
MVSAGKQRPKNLAFDCTTKRFSVWTEARFFSRRSALLTTDALFASQKWLLQNDSGGSRERLLKMQYLWHSSHEIRNPTA